MKRLVVIRDSLPQQQPAQQDAVVWTFEEFKRQASPKRLVNQCFRFKVCELIVYRLFAIRRPAFAKTLLRLLCVRSPVIRDHTGKAARVTWFACGKAVMGAARDFLTSHGLTKQVERQVTALSCAQPRPDSRKNRLCMDATPIYLRTELSYNITAGGSVGHIAGVLNNLKEFGGQPIYVASDTMPTIAPEIEQHIISPLPRYWDFWELPELAYNQVFYNECLRAIGNRTASFVYQRYSLHNYAGLQLATELAVPFVLEYNGSEVWMGKHWGKRLKYESLAERIELLVLQRADVVVVVSDVMKEELVGRGIKPDSILVNPNGVDTNVYSPSVDGNEIRKKLGVEGKTVIGFIGTLGPWHGAEVLVDAFGRLISMYPEQRESLRLLLIGDGPKMGQVKQFMEQHHLDGTVLLPGLIPQKLGPQYLAACDILASPHVPNPDGSKFFGSPTKLFEYMAMGKGIVASSLDQIGDILEHDKTAWMVKPGDAGALVEGLRVLIDNKELRDRLGAGARNAAVARHTWVEHTRRIIQRLSANR
jgi:glycosyltransferase involved in cell wall biosynthesis